MADVLFSDRTGADLTSAGTLRFNVVGGLLQAALSRASSTGGQLRPGQLGQTLSATLLLNRDELDAVAANRELRTALNRILRNLARVMEQRGKRDIRRLDLIRTGLLLSATKGVVFSDGGRSFNTAFGLENKAPYARYVHPKGRKGRRLVDNEWRVLANQMGDELIQDLLRLLMPKIERVLRARAAQAVLRGAR